MTTKKAGKWYLIESKPEAGDLSICDQCDTEEEAVDTMKRKAIAYIAETAECDVVQAAKYYDEAMTLGFCDDTGESDVIIYGQDDGIAIWWANEELLRYKVTYFAKQDYFEQTIRISKEKADKIREWLMVEPKDESEMLKESEADTFQVIAEFPEEFKMIISVETPGHFSRFRHSHKAWAKASLLHNGIIVDVIANDVFCRTWKMSYDNKHFTVNVVADPEAMAQ